MFIRRKMNVSNICTVSPFQPGLRMEEQLCFLLDEPLHGWWLQHVPHLQAGAVLLLAAGAVGALRGAFGGRDGRHRHGQGQQHQQRQRHRAHGREHAREHVPCQLQGWKPLPGHCHQGTLRHSRAAPEGEQKALYGQGFTWVSYCWSTIYCREFAH